MHFRQVKRRDFITLLGGAAAWVYAGIVSASGGTRNHGRAGAAPMTQDELAIIAYLERDLGRPLTPQEVRLSLAQARQVGDLPYDPVDGCGYRTEGPLPSNG